MLDSLEPLVYNVQSADKTDKRENHADSSEVEHRVVHLPVAVDCPEDFCSVFNRVQFGWRSRALFVVRWNNFKAEIVVYHFGRNLCFNLKTGFGQVHLFQGFFGKCPVSGEDIGHIDSMCPLKHPVHHIVSEPVQAGECSFLIICQTVSDNMVSTPCKERFNHGVGKLRRICSVSVEH